MSNQANNDLRMPVAELEELLEPIRGVGLDSSTGVSYTRLAGTGTGSVSLSGTLTKLADTTANGGAGISFSADAPARPAS